MYQMICPVLERLQAMEGGDASDGAGTGTEIDEVRGGLRRTHRGGLSQAEAAEVLGVSERTFRRWRDRYEAEGADGLYDRRLGRLAARRAAVDEVARVLELFDTRYWDFTAKHFHEKLVADHGFKRSYNWLRLSLQAHGRRRAAPRRDPLRRDRAAPCGQVDSRSAPDHFPTGPATPTEAVNSYGT